MKRMRINYWSCSKFADWVRGTPKGGAKTAGQWTEWREITKRKHPIRYWLAEEGLDHLQDVVMYPADVFRTVRYYIRNRWIEKNHALVAKPHHIAPGSYSDLTYRLFVCPFDALVDYVEVECAKMYNLTSDQRSKLPCAQSGLAYLSQMIQEYEEYDREKEVEQIKEIKELYQWWVGERANRKDPWDTVGLDAFYERMEKEYGDMFAFDKMSEKDFEELSALRSIQNELTEAYQKEDDEMLIRLIKIRHHLWT